MNLSYPLILGSKSPRRKEILEKAGFQFSCVSLDTEENYPADLPKHQVAAYLAELKAKAFLDNGGYQNKIILTADTTVLIENVLLEKPLNDQEAKQMLQMLSNKKHQVVSAFAILFDGKIKSFSDTTEVQFGELSNSVIESYIKEHQPFDKAGSYGIQEGIGLTHIQSLTGSYFTVMGLPIHKVYQELQAFIK